MYMRAFSLITLHLSHEFLAGIPLTSFQKNNYSIRQITKVMTRVMPLWSSPQSQIASAQKKT
jgi:hypothetical protein